MTMSSVSLSQLRGLTATEVNKLSKLGLNTTAELLKAAPSTKKEQELAKKAGISLDRMREAVNRADLVQVKGMGPAKADLFENAGVNSAKELAHRDPKKLTQTLEKYVTAHKELNYRAPDEKTVKTLVDRAKALYEVSDTGPVTTLDEAKDRAATALTDYVKNVLFGDGTDPRGDSYRHEILDGKTDAEKADIETKFLAELPAYLGRATSPLGNSALDTADADATGWQFTGRFNGLYTELHVDKADGAVKNLLVEVD